MRIIILNNTLPGTYLVEIVLRTTVQGGRIRFDWRDENRGNGVIEIFPERNGEWEHVTGIFKSDTSLESIGLAGPTHLGGLGFYIPEIDSRYIDVKSIALFKLNEYEK